MSSIRTTVHESLPYVDPEPTPAERAAAESLITSEQESAGPPPPPPAPLATPTFSPLIAAELDRIAAKQPLTGIDLSRYEATDPSSSPSTTSSDLSALQTTLTRAYAAAAYLSGRHAHLQLLDAYGRNAWLVGNWQLEAELRALERELEEARREVDLVSIQRRRAQDEVGGELKGLDEAWRGGVGRVLETEVATEGLRLQVLERQRGRG
ncbi:Pre-mRNA-splicing factor SPF27 [Hypoxylon rubiginosum]|uniref:Pre-mRNA-splicing factor SPF27 n=1 Tax=Hypoxylon rubiginosum TaxID=110542 RepID=A0ACB9Z4T6_9PEZI|nr:Pre-mRNA-splicing factor SPF27 [Hypoxylon rubiginosum]